MGMLLLLELDLLGDDPDKVGVMVRDLKKIIAFEYVPQIEFQSRKLTWKGLLSFVRLIRPL